VAAVGVYVLEVREPGKAAVRIALAEGPFEVGREATGLALDDPGVSRRHLRLIAGPDSLRLVDLGSTNGTEVNGQAVEGERTVSRGDVIRLAGTEIVVVDTGLEEDEAKATVPASDGPRPALDELATRELDGAVLRFRPGSAGEAAARTFGPAVTRARKRLAGLGSEPSGVKPHICLVDPFPDPSSSTMVASGTVVDSQRHEIWMVVTPEAPPEPPERPLALLFGASLPAADDLEPLLEGYGLFVAETPEPAAELGELQLPPLSEADGELRAAMARSFVGYLVGKAGLEGVRRLLSDARPGTVEQTAEDIFGSGLSALEERWRQELSGEGPPVKTTRFLRLALRYLRPYAKRQAELAVYVLFGLGFTVVMPFATRRLIDRAIPSGDFSQVLAILAVLAAAFVISLLAELRAAYVAAWISSSIVRDLRSRMFARLQALSAGWYHRHQEGDVTSRLFADVTAFELGLAQLVQNGQDAVLAFFVASAVALTLQPVLGAILILAAPMSGLVYKVMSGGAEKRSAAVQEQTGHLVSLATENYGGQSVVKAFALEEREQGRFARAADRVFRARVRLELYSGFFGLSVGGVATLLRLCMLGVGAWIVLRGGMTIGGLVAFFGVESQLLYPVRVLTTLGQRVQAASGALGRINELLDAVPEVDDAGDATPLPALEREITLEHVGFSYTPERRTLDGIDAVIPAGARVAFVGPTGAGKSSVLQLLLRLYDVDEGAVLFDGRDVRTATLASLRGQMGIVFQDTFLFNTTIAENVAMGRPGATEDDVIGAVEAAELNEFVATLPRGVDTIVGERGTRLSGGQRQRLAIARALVRNPRVLLLDEATSALDPRTERMISRTLKRVGEGRTTIAVTHRLTSVVDYDRIFVIVGGRLVEQGTHDELLGARGVYASLWAEQNGEPSPPEPPFDVAAALARTALFAGLDEKQLAAVARRMRRRELAMGEVVPEGGGLLVLVRGRAEVVVPDLAGNATATVELATGDAFGVPALLGSATGATLRILEPATVLELDDELSGLAAAFPPVAAVLEGRAPLAAGPAGGKRLSRVTGSFTATAAS
jgi:ABC-type multidrug transport system fused ATPase/permease subunit